MCLFFFFFQAEDGIRDVAVTGVQTCALPISIPAPLRREEDRAVAPPSVTPAPEGMLEAQIQQHRVVTRARAHADRERDARYDLQPARKIVGPADPGTDRQAVARGGAAWARHRLLPCPYDFEQGIEGRPRQPNDPPAEVARDRRCVVTHRVLGRGRSEEHTSEL